MIKHILVASVILFTFAKNSFSQEIKEGNYCNNNIIPSDNPNFGPYCFDVDVTEGKDFNNRAILILVLSDGKKLNCKFNEDKKHYDAFWERSNLYVSFYFEKNSLMVKSFEENQFKSFDFNGDLKNYQEKDDEVAYNYLEENIEIENQNVYPEVMGDYDEALVSNQYHWEDGMYVNSKSKELFREINFFSYTTYSRFDIFFENSKISEERKKEVVVMLELIDFNNGSINLYGIYNTVLNKYELYNEKDVLDYYFTFNETREKLTLFDKITKKEVCLLELVGSESDAFPSGARVYGPYLTIDNKSIIINSEFDDVTYEDKNITLNFESSPYGKDFIIEQDVEGTYEVFLKNDRKLFYIFKWDESKPGHFSLTDVKTKEVITARYDVDKE